MKPIIAKYFWNLNEKALKETGKILKNPKHPRFKERLVAFLSRCDKPKELFSLVTKQEFIEAWPSVKTYWRKLSVASDFRNWWQTIYEQMLRQQKTKRITPKGKAPASFAKIGKLIRTVRVRSGLSQSELAARVRMKQPDISLIEAGGANITLETLTSLCRVLGIKKIKL